MADAPENKSDDDEPQTPGDKHTSDDNDGVGTRYDEDEDEDDDEDDDATRTTACRRCDSSPGLCQAPHNACEGSWSS